MKKNRGGSDLWIILFRNLYCYTENGAYICSANW